MRRHELLQRTSPAPPTPAAPSTFNASAVARWATGNVGLSVATTMRTAPPRGCRACTRARCAIARRRAVSSAAPPSTPCRRPTRRPRASHVSSTTIATVRARARAPSTACHGLSATTAVRRPTASRLAPLPMTPALRSRPRSIPVAPLARVRRGHQLGLRRARGVARADDVRDHVDGLGDYFVSPSTPVSGATAQGLPISVLRHAVGSGRDGREGELDDRGARRGAARHRPRRGQLRRAHLAHPRDDALLLGVPRQSTAGDHWRPGALRRSDFGVGLRFALQGVTWDSSSRGLIGVPCETAV